MRDLAVLIPTRGRPGNIRNVVAAWDFTNAWDDADMVLVIDKDDPEYPGYLELVEDTRHPDTGDALIKTYEVDRHVPMVHKLNEAAAGLAPGWFALGFAGDDHLPQTIGWAARYLTVLHELGSGMVYGDDGYQGVKLSTEWAITADVVTALGRMVPADVEHMYCDNSMMDLFSHAGALRFLPEIRIEHMHPVAGKAETDEQYQRVNHRNQFSKDRRGYEGWRHGDVFLTDVAAVRHLRKGRPDVAAVRHLRKGRPDVTAIQPTPDRPRMAGSGPRKLQRSGPTTRRAAQALTVRPPRHFRNVRAATPEDVMTAIADFAVQVPADQEIVELGVFQGRTALQLAWGASLGNNAHVTGIDAWDLEGNDYGPPFTDPESRRWAQHWVDSFGYADKITLVRNFASDEAAVYSGPPVGLLFVDDDHSYAGARRAVEDWSRHLAPGARIAVDDYGHPDWPGVAMAVDDLVSEGILAPIEIFHDRLAVTRLANSEPKMKPTGTVTAITSEGVSPSPYPAVEDQVAAGPASVPEKAEPEIPEPWADQPDGFTDGSRAGSPHESSDPGQVDTEVSTQDPGLRVLVSAGELEDVAEGTSITDLNTVQLRALAKHRGIVLGHRKDKRAEMVQALTDGR